LDIRNGKITINQENQAVKLPEHFYYLMTTKETLIARVFSNIQVNYRNHERPNQRVILAAKNSDVDALNFTTQNMLSGELISFESINTVVDENETVNFPTKLLNSLNLPNPLPHNLQ